MMGRWEGGGCSYHDPRDFENMMTEDRRWYEVVNKGEIRSHVQRFGIFEIATSLLQHLSLTIYMYATFPRHNNSHHRPLTLPELLLSDLHLRFRLETPSPIIEI